MQISYLRHLIYLFFLKLNRKIILNWLLHAQGLMRAKVRISWIITQTVFFPSIDFHQSHFEREIRGQGTWELMQDNLRVSSSKSSFLGKEKFSPWIIYGLLVRNIRLMRKLKLIYLLSFLFLPSHMSLDHFSLISRTNSENPTYIWLSGGNWQFEPPTVGL